MDLEKVLSILYYLHDYAEEKNVVAGIDEALQMFEECKTYEACKTWIHENI